MFLPQKLEGRSLEGYNKRKKDGTVVVREVIEDQGKLLALQDNTIINYITYKMFLFKSDFNKARKMLEKLQNCILLSERMMFLLACTFFYWLVLFFSFFRACFTSTHLVYWQYFDLLV